MPGKVYLIGAGPGDPGMLSLRGGECLRRADVVLYDYLANPRLLDLARADAKLICLGKHGRDRLMPQSEVNEQMIAFARRGRIVARLKSGDPMIFGRAGDELAALATAGVEFEIVPGVTTALAVGAFAAIPLTHGEGASAVAFVTGQEREPKEAAALDYGALAAFPGTLVFYMAVTTARRWTSALVAAGKSPDTPCAIVRRCGWPDQQTIECTLAEVTGELEAEHIRPPVIVVVGDVVRYAHEFDWFTRRPLFGQTILNTRPTDRSDKLRDQLSELGAKVLTQPVIRILPPENWESVDRALAKLDQFDWLVFSSAKGVSSIIERLLATGRDLRALGAIKLATIGPGTAEELARYHLKADCQPTEYRAEALAEALKSQAYAKQRFLLARASRGRPTLSEHLRAAGGQVEEVVVYQSLDVTTLEPDVEAALAAGEIGWITVTSSAIARSLVSLLGERLRGARLASISPITSQVLRELGHEPAVEAAQYTFEGLTQAILGGTHKEDF